MNTFIVFFMSLHFPSLPEKNKVLSENPDCQSDVASNLPQE